jgi:hypothetical protein
MNSLKFATWDRSTNEAAAALAAARARLAESHARHKRQKSPTDAIYYPPTRKSPHEQAVDDIGDLSSLDAMVTRNHYGSIVLNAHHTLFIDVDMPDTVAAPLRADEFRNRNQGPWQTTFDDLCIVLANERQIGFRIYRTAAGFRVLATTREFEPESEFTKELMTSVGADAAFVHLCVTQKTFRARLTPKPWRCGTTRPPNQYPRISAKEQHCFAEWLACYDRASRDRATCQFLDQIGPAETHERVAPIIKFHDRHTKAFQALELA